MFGHDLRRLVKPVSSQIVIAGIVDLLATATRVFQAVMVARILAHVFSGGPFTGLTKWLIGYVIAQGVRALCFHIRDTLGARSAHQVKAAVREELYRKLLRLGPTYLTNERTGVVQTTMVDSVDRLDKYVELFLPVGLSSIISSILITAAVFYVDPVVGTVVVVSALVVAVAPILARGSLKVAMDHWMRGYREIYSNALDAIQGMSTLKAFNAHRQRSAELNDEAVEFCQTSFRLTVWATIREVALGFASTTGTTAAMLVGAWRLQHGDIDAGSLLLLLMLCRECFRPLMGLQDVLHSTYSVPASARQIREILDEDEPLTRAALEPQVLTDSALAINFYDVSYSYPGSKEPVLSSVSFSVDACSTLAIVGSSGSGKSTAVKLLTRNADPDSGTITLGGVDLRSLTSVQLHDTIALVSQDTYLFYGSVAENLRLAKADATDEELRTALQDAYAWEFVSRLDDGLETMIGERGVRLSGGQRQRLAIARAILADSRVLILDEATASVDAVSEEAIQKAIDRLRVDKTLVIVAHRLSTIYNADAVVVLNKGRVVETGTPSALSETDSIFARMVALQGGRQ